MKKVNILLLTLLMILMTVTGCQTKNNNKKDTTEVTPAMSTDVDEPASVTESDEPAEDVQDEEAPQEAQINNDIFMVPRSTQKVGGTLWGYADLADPYNNFVIEPAFTNVQLFQGDYAIVGIKDNQGILQKNGRFSVSLGKYEKVEALNNGYAIASKTTYKEDGTYDYRESYIIDVKGKVYDDTIGDPDAYYTYNEQINTFVKYSNLEGMTYFDQDTQTMLDIKTPSNYEGFNYILQTALPSSKDQELMPFLDEELQRYGYQNQSGEVVLAPIYINVEAFNHGVAIVAIEDADRVEYFNTDEFYGVIDEAGNWVIEPDKYFISRLTDERFVVTPFIGFDSFLREYQADYIKSALFDISGNQVINYEYYFYQAVTDDIITANDGQKTYFLDLEGTPLDLPVLDYQGIVTRVGDVLILEIPEIQVRSYYDTAGKLLFTDNADILLNQYLTIKRNVHMPYINVIYLTPQVIMSGDPEREKRLNDGIMENLNVNLSNIPDSLEDGEIASVDQTTFEAKLTGNVLSIATHSYWYGFGAAHGNGFDAYYHLSAVTGGKYQLSDLFVKGADYQSLLAKLMAEQYIKNDDKFMFTEDPIEIEKDLKSADYQFSIDQRGIEIHFGQYEIASYAAGMPSFKVSFEDLWDIIDVEGEFYQAITGRFRLVE